MSTSTYEQAVQNYNQYKSAQQEKRELMIKQTFEMVNNVILEESKKGNRLIFVRCCYYPKSVVEMIDERFNCKFRCRCDIDCRCCNYCASTGNAVIEISFNEEKSD